MKLSRFSSYPGTLLSADRATFADVTGQAMVMFIGEAQVQKYLDWKSLIAAHGDGIDWAFRWVLVRKLEIDDT
jgi:hypothetical protein